jgi:hypothetical protein
MPGIPSLGGGADTFDEQDTFVPEHVPEPGEFLRGQDVLTGEDHVAVHRMAREVFEERGVYDVTFGYNLAKLNRDARHESAGFRYAVETDPPEGAKNDLEVEGRVLRAEFTPTTEFCPQSDSLSVGAFRAFNGESDSHDYDLVRVRVDEMHHESRVQNMKLRSLEETYVETGEIRTDIAAGPDEDGEVPNERGMGAPF